MLSVNFDLAWILSTSFLLCLFHPSPSKCPSGICPVISRVNRGNLWIAADGHRAVSAQTSIYMCEGLNWSRLRAQLYSRLNLFANSSPLHMKYLDYLEFVPSYWRQLKLFCRLNSTLFFSLHLLSESVWGVLQIKQPPIYKAQSCLLKQRPCTLVQLRKNSKAIAAIPKKSNNKDNSLKALNEVNNFNKCLLHDTSKEKSFLDVIASQ